LATKAGEKGCLPPLAELRKILEPQLGVKTIERWMNWWGNAVWESQFWKKFQGQFLHPVQRNQFISGVWEHFKIQTNICEDFIMLVLKFFSPITVPQAYPF
jgi:hypothetical protein